VRMMVTGSLRQHVQTLASASGVALALIAVGCSAARQNTATLAPLEEVAHRRVEREVPASTTLESLPWKVGQWALYRRQAPNRSGEKSVTYQTISVLAEDACGIWIKVVQQAGADRSEWTACFRATSDSQSSRSLLDRLQVVITQRSGHKPIVTDFRAGRDADRRSELAWIAAVSRRRSWAGIEPVPGPVREDVEVPAGRFRQAVRETVGDSQGAMQWSHWYHPDVPFSGVIRTSAVRAGHTDGGYELILLDYGHEHAGSPVLAAATEGTSASEPEVGVTSPVFMALGIGSGWLVDGQQSSHRAMGLGLDWGYRVADTLDVQCGFRGIAHARESSPAGMTYDTLSVLLGMRWSPSRRARVRPRPLPYGASALYAQAAVGYTQLALDDLDARRVVARGIALGGAVGWLGFRGSDWALGVELSDHLAIYNADQRMRHNIAFGVIAQLYLPSGR
jgi:hypothetical protein